MDNLVGM
jgi:hypothetical protein